MTGLIHAGLIVLFLLASALFSGMETGGYLLNRLRLRFRVRQRQPSALRLQRSLRDAHLFIFTVLIGNNIAVYLLSRQVTNLYLRGGMTTESVGHSGVISWSAEAAATLTLMLPLFIFAELLPKKLFRIRADTLMYHCSGILCFFQGLFWPLTVTLKSIFNFLTAGRIRAGELSGFSLSLEGLREYFSGDTLQRALTEHQHGMIDNLVSMHRVPVRQVMQSRERVTSISEQASVREVLHLMRARDVDQVLIYRKTTRNVSGIVKVVDLLDSAVNPDDPVNLAIAVLPEQALPEVEHVPPAQVRELLVGYGIGQNV